jgi:DnaB-like helicase N terminal domain
MKPGVHPVIRAEQALLGSVLADPAGQAWLLDLIEPGDLVRPYHGQVLAAMNRVRGRGVAPWPLAVHEEIKKDPDLPQSVSSDGVLLADLMEAAPRPAHAPAYAAMVISTGIHRRLSLAASRVSQAAEGNDARAALRIAARAKRELDECRMRWEALPEPMRQELPAPAAGGRGQTETVGQLTAARDEIRRLRRDLTAGPQQELTGRLASIAQHIAAAATASTGLRQQQVEEPIQARPSGPEAEAAGAQALRDLAAAPSHISAVGAWLQPGHFARAEDGELYAVMRDMASVGKPIDPATVTWEAAKRGIEADAANLANGTGPFATASAREVHRHGRLAEVSQVAHKIQATATDWASPPGTLLSEAACQLGRLEGSPGHNHHRQVASVARAGHRPATAVQHQIQDRESAREAIS